MFGRKKKGETIINKNIEKVLSFGKIVEGIQQGIHLCQEEITANKAKIEKLTAENERIEGSQVLASSLKGCLDKALAEFNSPEKKRDK